MTLNHFVNYPNWVNKAMQLSSVGAVVFDLDGTIYCGNTLVEGAAELLTRLRHQGIQTYYCTNNSTKTKQEISLKLNEMGLPATPEIIFSAAYAAAHYLNKNNFTNVYCFGEAGLRNELKSFDISIVSTPDEAAVVLIGLDTNIDYKTISRLLPLRKRACWLVACNRDKFFPSDNGIMQLGCGFIVSLVEDALEKEIDYTVGKPNTNMLDMLIEEHGLAMDEIVVVGDSLESDIAMAQAAGCRSVYLSSEPASAEVLQVKSHHELWSLFK
jgi:HAD superfamily hydrolase (TIGR01450 family)